MYFLLCGLHAAKSMTSLASAAQYSPSLDSCKTWKRCNIIHDYTRSSMFIHDYPWHPWLSVTSMIIRDIHDYPWHPWLSWYPLLSRIIMISMISMILHDYSWLSIMTIRDYPWLFISIHDIPWMFMIVIIIYDSSIIHDYPWFLLFLNCPWLSLIIHRTFRAWAWIVVKLENAVIILLFIFCAVFL